MNRQLLVSGLCGLFGATLSPAARAEAPTGFQPTVRVRQPTRLDWEFVASGFGKDATRLPAEYDSRKQTFQLYVPANYNPDRSWPLVVFISPGDRPDGWRSWQPVCEREGMLFCAPFAAGNNCPAGQRVRIVLDMLDQVRRDYRIDPDQTYASGFSGGGRMACTVAFSLPEYFGGVVPICGTNPLGRLDYLRHRVQDRLSVAFVTGEKDFNRAENEQLMQPMLKDLGVRTRLWVVPGMSHAMSGKDVLAEVGNWLHEDLKRRRQDTEKRPELAVPPDDELTPEQLGRRLLRAAEKEMKEERIWRGVTILQGIRARWGSTRAAEQAKQELADLEKNEARLRLAGEQGGSDERIYLLAQATAFQRFNQPERALAAWKMLADEHPNSPEGMRAAKEVVKLQSTLLVKPFLGMAFSGESSVLLKVETGGPADAAGLRPGDKLTRIADQTVRNLNDVRAAMVSLKPGDKVKIQLERKGVTSTVEVLVGSPPSTPK